MPIGLQFGNLNKYRRYPFSPGADLSCEISGHSPEYEKSGIPNSFVRLFRLVSVRSGGVPVSSARLTNAELHPVGDDPASAGRYSGSFSFSVLGVDGKPIPFFCKGSEVSGGVVSFGWSGSLGDPVKSFSMQFSDFDFTSCLSLFMVIDYSGLPDLFDMRCSAEFDPGTILSLDAPHVTSILDDNGTPIRGAGIVELEEGYNTRIDAVADTNTIVVSALRGGGSGKEPGESGMPCGKSGLAPGFSSSTLRSVNGVSATPSGDITITGGGGVNIEAIPHTNIINIYSESETKSDVECKTK